MTLLVCLYDCVHRPFGHTEPVCLRVSEEYPYPGTREVLVTLARTREAMPVQGENRLAELSIFKRLRRGNPRASVATSL